MPINFGVIGTGWITNDYVSHAQSTGKWNLAAVYSRKTETAQAFAAKFPKNAPIAIHTTIDSLAADPSISTVYIASPNLFHYAQAHAMLSAGKHVILEKPATPTSASLSSLFELAYSKNLILIEAFRHLHERNFHAVEAALPRLGRLFGASLSFCQYSSRYDNVLRGEKPGVFDLDMAGGALVDLGVYTVSAAVKLFGVPESSTYTPVIIGTGADGGGVLVLRYKEFAVTLTASKVFYSGAPCEVFGEKGTLGFASVTDIAGVGLWDPRRKGVREEVGGEKAEWNLSEEAGEFARIIEERDWGAVRKWEAVSRAVVAITERARWENGLLFPGEE